MPCEREVRLPLQRWLLQRIPVLWGSTQWVLHALLLQQALLRDCPRLYDKAVGVRHVGGLLQRLGDHSEVAGCAAWLVAGGDKGLACRGVRGGSVWRHVPVVK